VHGIHAQRIDTHPRLYSCARSHIIFISILSIYISWDEANCYFLLSLKQSYINNIRISEERHDVSSFILDNCAEKNTYIDLIKITTIDIYPFCLF
jgi:hypothetical protein